MRPDYGPRRPEVTERFTEKVARTISGSEITCDASEDEPVGESTGHASGRGIIEIKRSTVDELDDDDHAHMRTVVGDVHRHLAQRPDGDVTDTAWRYSLMNWRHDPLG
jgi:hypothetical protein